MNKKLRRFAESNAKVYLVTLVLFTLVTVFFKEYELALAELSIILLLVVYALIARRRKEKQLSKYIESMMYDTENAKNSTLMNFPLPIAVFRLNDTGISWANEMFFEVCGIGGSRLEARLTDVVPDFSGKWLTEGKSEYPTLVEINGKSYQVHGNLVTSEKGEESGTFMGITYWIDVTDYEEIKNRFKATRPVASIIVIDNLEELYRNQTERVKNDIRDAIEDSLNAWVDKHGGIIRRFERDRYVALFERQAVEEMRTDKFDIIKQVHAVKSPGGVEASLSIGIGLDAEGLQETLQFAVSAGELALTRGGDQTVIKTRTKFEFFGGRGGEVEKRTKVRSRVMANTLADLMRDSEEVFVMGHSFSDLDSVGASAGVCCAARKLGVKPYIVIDAEHTASESLLKYLRSADEYADMFITPQDAMLRANGRSLLVVVDTNRPEQVEDRDLLESINRVAVIDHHRVAATRIQNAAMAFVEPYASSACELLTEIIEVLCEPADIYRCEADAMLAGITLDTKNFSLRTGERTFEAAAYLRRAGADTTTVKKFSQTDMSSNVAKYAILQQAHLYRDIVAVAVPQGQHSRVVLAKAADELLNVSGVEASIVAASDGKGNVNVSARSINDINVQIIMESIGGGGNRSAAAALLPNVKADEAEKIIIKAIDDYFG